MLWRKGRMMGKVLRLCKSDGWCRMGALERARPLALQEHPIPPVCRWPDLKSPFLTRLPDNMSRVYSCLSQMSMSSGNKIQTLSPWRWNPFVRLKSPCDGEGMWVLTVWLMSYFIIIYFPSSACSQKEKENTPKTSNSQMIAASSPSETPRIPLISSLPAAASKVKDSLFAATLSAKCVKTCTSKRRI